MGAHEAADGVLTRMEADRLRARALELVAELDTIQATSPWDTLSMDVSRWAGRAVVILAEVARG